MTWFDDWTFFSLSRFSADPSCKTCKSTTRLEPSSRGMHSTLRQENAGVRILRAYFQTRGHILLPRKIHANPMWHPSGIPGMTALRDTVFLFYKVPSEGIKTTATPCYWPTGCCFVEFRIFFSLIMCQGIRQNEQWRGCRGDVGLFPNPGQSGARVAMFH